MLLRTCLFVSTLLTTVPLSAQIPAPPKDVIFFSRAVAGHPVDSGQVSDELIGKVRTTLSLTDVQVTALKALLTMRSQAITEIQQKAIESQKTLQDLLSQSNPNPTAVGNAFLATRSVQDQLKAAQEKFRLDFRAFLTNDQRATLDRLQAASEQSGSLVALGILAGGAEGPFVVTGPNPESGFAIGIQPKLSKDR